ncbi:MAG: methyltransferase family protein [Candidatus Helarchaeota archaeon]
MSEPIAENSNKTKNGLNRYGIRGITRDIFLILVYQVILLISADDIWWINAWIFTGIVLTYQIINDLILIKLNPQLLNERGKLIQKNTKTFDKVFIIFYVLLTVSLTTVAGFDAVRYKWTNMPFELIIIGVIIFIPAAILGIWAMVVNTFFETTVRIQRDRDHQVCSSGPYKVIRHPGYTAEIISLLSYPFFLGSWWSFPSIGALIILFIIRTAKEDRTLQQELAGYKEYTKTTRYRLIPILW